MSNSEQNQRKLPEGHLVHIVCKVLDINHSQLNSMKPEIVQWMKDCVQQGYLESRNTAGGKPEEAVVKEIERAAIVKGIEFAESWLGWITWSDFQKKKAEFLNPFKQTT